MPGRRCQQVVERYLYPFRRVAKEPYSPVASPAQQAAHFARVVIMVDIQRQLALADRAAAILYGGQRLKLGFG